MNKYIITKMPLCPLMNVEKDTMSMVTALMDEQHALSLSCIPREEDYLNNIYIGRVDSISENIKAIFVKISPDEICYLPYEELPYVTFTHKPSNKEIAVGDELLVQVVRRPIKTKLATVSARLNISGQYVAVTSGPSRIGISKKIPKQKGKELKEFLKEHTACFHEMDIIARTNSAYADSDDILSEATRLSSVLSNILQYSKTKTLYSCVYTTEPDYISFVKNSYPGEISEIVTDIDGVYESLLPYMKDYPNILLRYYEDSYPLYQLFSLTREFSDALSKKVWLKSGAYLIIEPTEALTVIDVNSGKNEKKKSEDYFLNINKEAALEIARQLRLRNISGICIVDFIDMPIDQQQKELLSFMRKLLKSDHITTTAIDMTKLNLMEITRKKTNPTLYQQIFQDIVD
ncbi:MAG: ribonuclease E/G [Lachnospiraceae bacterium]|nr:ribonuclease E/G [Lachnospiraceae bacterium]